MNHFLYRLQIWHGKLHERTVFSAAVVRGFVSSLFQKRRYDEDYPVDFVVTWVDGNDPEWQAKKAEYQPGSTSNKDGAERYRDWSLFRYWFRAVETYAPWVNRVYLVTDRQVPGFLNLHSEKIRVVDHTEIIDCRYLPVFNSCAIEANLHKIPGLSEHFVYFNDDVFLTRPVEKADFFQNGLPKYTLLPKPAKPPRGKSVHSYQVLTTMGLVNKDFAVRSSILKHPDKWFSYVNYGTYHLTKQVFSDGYLSTLASPHLAVPYRKSTWNTVTEKHREEFDETSSHRFRSVFDVIHYAFYEWEILSGTFVPVKTDYYGKSYSIDVKEQFLSSLQAIGNFKYRTVCLNDDEFISNEAFLEMRDQYVSAFEAVFPHPSAFEKADPAGAEKAETAEAPERFKYSG